MAMRWYQHSTQTGTSMTSLKNRLVSVAAVTMAQAKTNNTQARCIAPGA